MAVVRKKKSIKEPKQVEWQRFIPLFFGNHIVDYRSTEKALASKNPKGCNPSGF